MTWGAQQQADATLSRFAEQGKPTWGVVSAVAINGPVTINGKKAANAPGDVSYTIKYTTMSGSKEVPGLAPSQARWDCQFYPAPIGAVVNLYWVRGSFYFTVLELPVTSQCGTTTGGTSPGTPTLGASNGGVRLFPVQQPGLIDYVIRG